MKGLLIKDLHILKNQLNFFMIVCAIGLLMMFTQENTYFAISYSTFIFSMFTLSTISYDEFDNGTAFLFTLPINKKVYVIEKYVFGILIGSATWLIATIISGVYTLVKHPQTNMVEWLMTSIIFIFLPMLFLSLTLPVQIKFGAEKGRVAMFGVVGVVVLTGFIAGYLFKLAGVNVSDALESLVTIGLGKFLIIVALLCSAIYAVSFSISLKIMEKKQF